MIRQGDGGRMVNVTSVHEHRPPLAAPYRAAKGGLGLLTRGLALEPAEYGSTVNAVAPGEIATPMTGQEAVDVHTRERPGVPLGRPGDAREAAAVIALPAGAGALYVTGASTAACSERVPGPAPTCGAATGGALSRCGRAPAPAAARPLERRLT